MNKNRRDPAKEIFWRSAFKRQKHSGMTVKAFCESEKLNLNLFWAWSREIRKRDQEKERNRAASRGSKESMKPLTEFLPITLKSETVATLKPESSVEPDNSRSLRIHAPGGLVLVVPENVDTGALRVVLSALRKTTC